MFKDLLSTIETIFSMDNEYFVLVLRTILLIVILKLISKLIVMICAKNIKTSRKIFLFNHRVTILLDIAIYIGIFLIWSKYLKDLITIISFVSAGITIAMRDVIFNLFAGFFINTKKPFKLEDRIEVDGIKGDVVVINALSFKILEVGDRINGEQSSGLIINIPNSYIFTKALKNYNTAFKYIWDEIVVKVPIDCDIDKNKKEILKIVNENGIVSRIPKKMNKAIEDASLDYRIYYNHLEPIIYTKVVDDYVELDVRFLVHPKKERIVEDDIWTKILKEYKKGKINLYKKS